MSIPQRVYVYLAAFISFAILLQGAYGLATDTLSGDTFNRATWLAMVIVGLPVWLAHELLVRRAATRHADETASTIRKLYVHGALALASLYVFFGAYYVVEGFAEDLGDNLENIGGIIVAGALWYYIWRRENLEGQPGPRARTVKRWRVYGLSLIFLTTAVAGTYWITYGLAYAVYNAIFAPDLFVSGSELEITLRTSAGWAIVGAAGWVIQWRAVADSDEESVLRRVYLYGFAFIGAALLSLWAASATLFVLIAKLVGADDTYTTVEYVRQFILPIVGLIIGLAILAYHWSIIRRDAARRTLTNADAVRATKRERPVIQSDRPVILSSVEEPTLSTPFKYIMAAVGLIALVPGLMGLLIAILYIVTDDAVLTSTNDNADVLAVSLTMVIVGGPLWAIFWWRVVYADARSLIRRIYLYLALGAFGGTTIFTLITLLAAVLTEVLGEGSSFLAEALIPTVSIIIPAAAFFAYHVNVLRDDARRAPRTSPGAAPAGSPGVVIPAPPYVVPRDSRLRP